MKQSLKILSPTFDVAAGVPELLLSTIY